MFAGFCAVIVLVGNGIVSNTDGSGTMQLNLPAVTSVNTCVLLDSDVVILTVTPDKKKHYCLEVEIPGKINQFVCFQSFDEFENQISKIKNSNQCQRLVVFIRADESTRMLVMWRIFSAFQSQGVNKFLLYVKREK